MSTPATKKDVEKQTKVISSAIETVEQSDNYDDNEVDISDSSIDALKYALHSLIHNKGSIAGTTNLNATKIRAISRMKALNFFYKSKAIDGYYENVLELYRSETKNPASVMEIMGNLFKYQPNQNPGGIVNKVTRFMRR